MKRLYLLISCCFCLSSLFAQDVSQVAATPPMGWNSYDCYGASVTEQEVKANADFIVRNLKQYGWKYVVVDYCWYYPLGPNGKTKEGNGYLPSLPMDQYGRLLPSIDKFPSAAGGKGFKPLGDYIHSLGLKFGIHVMRGIPRQAVWAKTPVLGVKGVNAAMIADTNSKCPWLNVMYGLNMNKAGAQKYLNSLLKLYASWGVDFIKVDDISNPYHAKEIAGYHKAIEHCGRKIVLSLSPGETPLSEAHNVVKYANMWRLSGDLWDNWKQLKHAFDLAAKWAPYAGPGHWPDMDMLPIGKLSIRNLSVGPERYSNFTNDEERTLMTLWCIARLPLVLGGNLPENRRTENKLETNTAVLNVDQHSTDSRQLYRKNGVVIWVSRAADGKTRNVALFNLNDEPQDVTAGFTAMGIKRKCRVRDLWAGKDIGIFKKQYRQKVNAHGAVLLSVTPL